MNDRTHRSDDGDVIAAITAATMEPTEAFRARLRADLLTEASGDDLVSLRSRRSSHRRVWPLLVASVAAVVLLVVAVAVVTRSGGDDDTVPADGLLREDDLAQQLAGRTWVALDRFDVPVSPSVVTTLTFGVGPDGSTVTVVDCATTTISFRFTGNAIDNADGDAGACTYPALPVGALQRVELADGADTFTLLDEDDARLAVFTDLETLPVARADELLADPLFSSQIERVWFTAGGRGQASLCTELQWSEATDGAVSVSVVEPDRPCAFGDDELFEPSEFELRLREITDPAATVAVAPQGLLLHSTSGRGTIVLRPLPTVQTDPNRITLAAGALFGIEPGIGTTPEMLIDAAAPVLGDPDHDSGWIDEGDLVIDQPAITCGLDDYRELVWGDLTAAFWGTGSRTALHLWYLGDDPFAALLARPRLDRDDPERTTGLTTEHGVALGDPADAIPDRFGIVRGVEDPESGRTSVSVQSALPDAIGAVGTPQTRGGTYLIEDDVVVAIGAIDIDCAG